MTVNAAPARTGDAVDVARLTREGVRRVTVDRPGVGFSDPLPGRALLDWPDDVRARADALDLDRFAVLGTSGGGPYAAACCFALPDRVTRAALVSGLGPMDRSGAWKGSRLPAPSSQLPAPSSQLPAPRG